MTDCVKIKAKLVKKLYSEIKTQMHRSDHPIYYINKAFRKAFTRQYRSYVLKKQSQSKDEAVSMLCHRIDRATVKLKSNEASNHISSEDDDIRFSDKVLGDVKRVIAISLFTAFKFYQL